MKLLTLIFGVVPLFLFAQGEKGIVEDPDTIKPTAEKLYSFGTGIDNSVRQGWKLFDNDMVARIHYPKEWEFIENFMGTILVIKSPLTGDKDPFAENISLTREFLLVNNKTFTLEDIILKKREECKNYFTDFTIIEEIDATYQNGVAKTVIFSGKKSNIEFKIQEYFFLKGDVAYIYTYTAEATVFETFKSIADDIYKSLRVR
jgi:hypothetical protein